MSAPMWPAGNEGKHLLCVRAQCSAQDLFRTLWVAPDLPAQLHKIRNDTNFKETAWLESQDALPKTEEAWDTLQVASGQHAPPVVGQWRKCRFDSPPMAMATKPFQNEELQHCLELVPGNRYVFELKANTSAPYGDKFDLYFKYYIVAETKMTASLHIEFTLVWNPSVNRMLKTVIQKAIESGVFGSFKSFREVLETFHIVEDMDPKDIRPMEPEQPAAAAGAPAAAPAAPAPTPVPAAPSVPAPAASMFARQPSLALIADHGRGVFTHFLGSLVWGDQVDSISEVVSGGRRVNSRESKGARMLASLVTLSLVHTMVSVLQGAQSACADRRGVLWFLCLPLTHLIDVPDTLFEVMTALILVASINYIVIYATKLSLNAGGRASLASGDSLFAPTSQTAPAANTVPATDAPPASDTKRAESGATGEGAAGVPSGAMADPVTAAAAAAAATSGTKEDAKEGAQGARTQQTGSGPGSAGAVMKGSGPVLSAMRRPKEASSHAAGREGSTASGSNSRRARASSSGAAAKEGRPLSKGGSGSSSSRGAKAAQGAVGDAAAPPKAPPPPSPSRSSAPSFTVAPSPSSASTTTPNILSATSPTSPHPAGPVPSIGSKPPPSATLLQLRQQEQLQQQHQHQQLQQMAQREASATGAPLPTNPAAAAAAPRVPSSPPTTESPAVGAASTTQPTAAAPPPPSAAAAPPNPSLARLAASAPVSPDHSGPSATHAHTHTHAHGITHTAAPPPPPAASPSSSWWWWGDAPAPTPTSSFSSAAPPKPTPAEAGVSLQRSSAPQQPVAGPPPLQAAQGGHSGSTRKSVEGALAVGPANAPTPTTNTNAANATNATAAAPTAPPSPPIPPLTTQPPTLTHQPLQTAEGHAAAHAQSPQLHGTHAAVATVEESARGCVPSPDAATAAATMPLQNGALGESAYAAAAAPDASMLAAVPTAPPPPVERRPSTSGPIVASQPNAAAAAAALAAAAAAVVDDEEEVATPPASAQPTGTSNGAKPGNGSTAGSNSASATRPTVPPPGPKPGGGPGTSGSSFVAGAQFPPGALLQASEQLNVKGGQPNLDAISESFKGLGSWHRQQTGLSSSEAEAIMKAGLLGGGSSWQESHSSNNNNSSTTGIARALGYTGPSLDAYPNSPITSHSFAQNTGPLAPHFEQRLLLVQALAEKARAQSRDVTSDVVVEEVFENERFQPFRGWGHNWPGHFLPTDRVGHWSDRSGKPGGYASMEFEQVEPTLPNGYSWEEDVWRIDFTGAEPSVKAVDENGWTYAIDFNYLEFPFSVGGGIVRMNQFVRRRRWTRKRIKNSAIKRLYPDQASDTASHTDAPTESVMNEDSMSGDEEGSDAGGEMQERVEEVDGEGHEGDEGDESGESEEEEEREEEADGDGHGDGQGDSGGDEGDDSDGGGGGGKGGWGGEGGGVEYNGGSNGGGQGQEQQQQYQQLQQQQQFEQQQQQQQQWATAPQPSTAVPAMTADRGCSSDLSAPSTPTAHHPTVAASSSMSGASPAAAGSLTPGTQTQPFLTPVAATPLADSCSPHHSTVLSDSSQSAKSMPAPSHTQPIQVATAQGTTTVNTPTVSTPYASPAMQHEVPTGQSPAGTSSNTLPALNPTSSSQPTTQPPTALPTDTHTTHHAPPAPLAPGPQSQHLPTTTPAYVPEAHPTHPPQGSSSSTAQHSSSTPQQQQQRMTAEQPSVPLPAAPVPPSPSAPHAPQMPGLQYNAPHLAGLQYNPSTQQRSRQRQPLFNFMPEDDSVLRLGPPKPVPRTT